jgi:hypothetical protein
VQVRTADTAVRDLDIDVGLFPLLGSEFLPDHVALAGSGIKAHPAFELVVCRHVGDVLCRFDGENAEPCLWGLWGLCPIYIRGSGTDPESTFFGAGNFGVLWKLVSRSTPTGYREVGVGMETRRV